MLELFRKRPLFCVESEAELLDKIIYTCGVPTASSWPEFATLAKDMTLPKDAKGGPGNLDKVRVVFPPRSILGL